MKRAVTVVLSPIMRAHLEKWAKSYTSFDFLKRRASIILLSEKD